MMIDREPFAFSNPFLLFLMFSVSIFFVVVVVVVAVGREDNLRRLCLR